MIRVKVIAVPVLILVCLITGILPNSTVNAAFTSSFSVPDIPSPGDSESPTSTDASDELPYRTDSTLTVTPLPKLGETVDLTFTVKVVRSDSNVQPYKGLARSKAWIDFYWTNIHGSYSEAYSSVRIPEEEVLVSGELTWEGSYKDSLTLYSKIKLPREGIWSIRGHFYGEGWLAGVGAEIGVAVADGTAAIMRTEEFKAGPLAYLGNLTYYGGVWPPSIPNDIHPVSLGLDISKAPRAGEQVTLSARIISIIAVSDFSIEWYFYKRTGDTTKEVPAAELLSASNLGWKTDIKKDEPVVFSTAIKFPTEGDWEIVAAGKSGTKPLIQTGHRLKLSITSAGNHFGWNKPLGKITFTDRQSPGVKAIYNYKAAGTPPMERQTVGPVKVPTQVATPGDESLKPAHSESAMTIPAGGKALLDSGWALLMYEDFEGAFPSGNWTLAGNPTWDDDDYKAYSGSWSAWCANGGTNGLDPQSNDYPNNMNDLAGNTGRAIMKYGPFDLSQATSAKLDFKWWNESEAGYDYFSWFASGNGFNWDSFQNNSGTTNPVWTDQSFSLDNFVGDDSVWIGFCFNSDYSNTYKGAFVDDIYLLVSPDTILPSVVTDLAVDSDSPTPNSLSLTWTSPGDDGNYGTASQYDIRYSTSPINASNWSSAIQAIGEPIPLAAGNTQDFVVTGLNHSTTYYFAIKTADETPNWSVVSNSPFGTTIGLTVSGQWKYRNRDWTNTNPTFSYANQFLVYLTPADNPLNVLKEGVTDPDGSFNLGPVSYTGNMTLRINASVHYVDGQNYDTKIFVHKDYTTGPAPVDIFWDAHSYTFPYVINSNRASLGEIEICPRIIIPPDQDLDREDVLDAFWMKDDLDQGFKYILKNQELHPHPDWSWPTDETGWLIVLWEPKGDAPTTDTWYYERPYIFLDGWKDQELENPWSNGAKHKNVTLHEMGHKVMDVIYGNTIVDNGWKEGWPDFWPCAVTDTHNLGAPTSSPPPYGHDLEAGNYAPVGQPTAYWKFDENYGNIAGDASGCSHTGAVNGPTWTNGKYGSALQFDGINDNVNASGWDMGGDGATVSFWIKPSSSGSNSGVIAKGSGKLAVYYSGGKIVVKHQGNSDLVGNMNINNGNWHHVIVVYETNKTTIYIDGQVKGSNNLDFLESTTTGDNVYLGSDSTGNYFSGCLDDIHIYDVGSLSQGALSALYTGNYQTETANVASALWDLYDRFNDGYYDEYDGAQADKELGVIWEAFVDQHDKPFDRNSLLDFWARSNGFRDRIPGSEVTAARALFQNSIIYDDLLLYLTGSAGAGGTISPSGQITASYVGSQTFNINPNTGYHIASITDNGISVNPPLNSTYTITSLTSDHSVVVTFAINTYNITASVSGGNGSVSPANQSVNYGLNTSVLIYPDSGYHISSILDNSVSQTITMPYVISNVTADHTVILTFATAVQDK